MALPFPALPSLQPLGSAAGERLLQLCDLGCSSEGNISSAFHFKIATHARILMCYKLLKKLEKAGADLRGVSSRVGSWTLSSSECWVQVSPSFLALFVSILLEFQMFSSCTYVWVLFSILLEWGGESAFVGRSYCGGCSQLVLGSMSFFLSRCSVLPNKGKTCVPQCCDKSEV